MALRRPLNCEQIIAVKKEKFYHVVSIGGFGVRIGMVKKPYKCGFFIYKTIYYIKNAKTDICVEIVKILCYPDLTKQSALLMVEWYWLTRSKKQESRN